MENTEKQSPRKTLSIRFGPEKLSFHIQTGADARTRQATWDAIDKAESTAEGIDRALGAAADETFDAVHLFPETARCVLVPEELFEAETAENYLRVNGFDLADEETVVVSPAVAGTRAVMAVPRETVARFETVFPEAHYFSPLQLLLAALEPGAIQLLALHGHMAIAAFAGSDLQFAEILPCPSVDSALFYLHRLQQTPGLRKNRIIASGLPEDDFKALRKYHKIGEISPEERFARFNAAVE